MVYLCLVVWIPDWKRPVYGQQLTFWTAKSSLILEWFGLECHMNIEHICPVLNGKKQSSSIIFMDFQWLDIRSPLYTVTIWILDYSAIGMVSSCQWSGIQMVVWKPVWEKPVFYVGPPKEDIFSRHFLSPIFQSALHILQLQVYAFCADTVRRVGTIKTYLNNVYSWYNLCLNWDSIHRSTKDYQLELDSSLANQATTAGWEKPVYDPKCPEFEWSTKSHDFTIKIPPILSSIQMNPVVRCSVFRWLLYL